MRPDSSFLRILWITVVLLFLSACNSAGGLAATATPLPASATPAPTTTPQPTATTAAAAPAAAVEEPTTEPTAVPLHTYRMIPEDSKALYRVEEEFFSGAVERLGKALGFNTAVAWTRTLEGEVQLIFDGPTVIVQGGQFTVDLRSLKSDDNRRDERIREQYLQSNQFPLAEFAITGVEDFPAEYRQGDEITFKLMGDFTMRQTTNPVVFTTTAVLQDNILSGTAFTDIFMVDFGFDPPEIAGFLKALDPARVEVEFMAQKTETPTE